METVLAWPIWNGGRATKIVRRKQFLRYRKEAAPSRGLVAQLKPAAAQYRPLGFAHFIHLVKERLTHV